MSDARVQRVSGDEYINDELSGALDRAYVLAAYKNDPFLTYLVSIAKLHVQAHADLDARSDNDRLMSLAG